MLTYYFSEYSNRHEEGIERHGVSSFQETRLKQATIFIKHGSRSKTSLIAQHPHQEHSYTESVLLLLQNIVHRVYCICFRIFFSSINSQSFLAAISRCSLKVPGVKEVNLLPRQVSVARRSSRPSFHQRLAILPRLYQNVHCIGRTSANLQCSGTYNISTSHGSDMPNICKK